MRDASKFQRGSGCFKCECCGRMTRLTSVQSSESECCPECYELAGLQNAVFDGCFTIEDAPEVRRLISQVEKKGGKLPPLNTDVIEWLRAFRR